MNSNAQNQAIRLAVQHFWMSRAGAGERQNASEDADRGERASVTAGKHLDGFARLFTNLTEESPVRQPVVRKQAQLNTLPGFFRPTKKWDILIHGEGRLIAAIELKSHVGPSFGNNCNNRAEEAIGNATDFWTAYREGAFGKFPRPFLGYLMLLEDCPAVHIKPARPLKASYFEVFPEFRQANYADRYRLLCEKLVLESLYTCAAVILTPRSAANTGEYTEISKTAGIDTFIAELRGKLASQASPESQVTVRVREDPPVL
jgi:hypothetical protein